MRETGTRVGGVGDGSTEAEEVGGAECIKSTTVGIAVGWAACSSRTFDRNQVSLAESVVGASWISHLGQNLLMYLDSRVLGDTHAPALIVISLGLV